MTILVTGAAGFVALNVVEHLLRSGRDVVGLDRIPLPARAAALFPTLPGRLTWVEGSIVLDSDLNRAFAMDTGRAAALDSGRATPPGGDRATTAPDGDRAPASDTGRAAAPDGGRTSPSDIGRASPPDRDRASAPDTGRASAGRIEAVLHLAVITAGAAREKADPETIVAVNVQGAVATLMAAVRHGVTRFVYPSSGSIYGSAAAGVAVIEEDALKPAPVALYGLTKLAAETILTRVAAVQGVRFTAARLGSVYGPWEYATGVRDTLSPMLQAFEHAMAGTEAVLGPPWGGDYIYARDVAAGLVALLDAPTLTRPIYNLGSGRGATVVDWCQALQAVSPGFRWRLAAPGEAYTVESHTGFDRGGFDVAKLAAETGFRARFGFTEAAADWVSWARGGA